MQEWGHSQVHHAQPRNHTNTIQQHGANYGDQMGMATSTKWVARVANGEFEPHRSVIKQSTGCESPFVCPCQRSHWRPALRLHRQHTSHHKCGLHGLTYEPQHQVARVLQRYRAWLALPQHNAGTALHRGRCGVWRCGPTNIAGVPDTISPRRNDNNGTWQHLCCRVAVENNSHAHSSPTARGMCSSPRPACGQMCLRT